MDNDKLSSIIKETEANLMRLKQQYRSREPPTSPYKYPGSWNVPPPIEMESSANRGSSLLFGFLNQIKGQLDEQTQTLQKINSTVQKLEAENTHYKQELITAHSNVLQLSSLLDNERRKSYLSLERHLIQMQDMLCTELKKMSHEIKELKLKCRVQNCSTTPEPAAYPPQTASYSQSKKPSQKLTYLTTPNGIYEDPLKMYNKVKKRPPTVATSKFQYPSPSSSVQLTTTRLRGYESAPCPQTAVPEPQILSHINQKILEQSYKRIRDKIPRSVANSSKMSSASSERDLHSLSQTLTISSSQNLTLQSDEEEEDLHSDDSNFDLLDSRNFGKIDGGLESSSSEDLMSECESYCSEKLS